MERKHDLMLYKYFSEHRVHGLKKNNDEVLKQQINYITFPQCIV